MKDVKVLGTGCVKCTKLFENVQAAVKEAGLECKLEKVEDIEKILDYGVMMTPGLVVDGKVVSTGRVLPSKDIIALLNS